MCTKRPRVQTSHIFLLVPRYPVRAYSNLQNVSHVRGARLYKSPSTVTKKVHNDLQTPREAAVPSNNTKQRPDFPCRLSRLFCTLLWLAFLRTVSLCFSW